MPRAQELVGRMQNIDEKEAIALYAYIEKATNPNPIKVPEKFLLKCFNHCFNPSYDSNFVKAAKEAIAEICLLSLVRETCKAQKSDSIVDELCRKILGNNENCYIMGALVSATRCYLTYGNNAKLDNNPKLMNKLSGAYTTYTKRFENADVKAKGVLKAAIRLFETVIKNRSMDENLGHQFIQAVARTELDLALKAKLVLPLANYSDPQAFSEDECSLMHDALTIREATKISDILDAPNLLITLKRKKKSSLLPEHKEAYACMIGVLEVALAPVKSLSPHAARLQLPLQAAPSSDDEVKGDSPARYSPTHQVQAYAASSSDLSAMLTAQRKAQAEVEARYMEMVLIGLSQLVQAHSGSGRWFWACDLDPLDKTTQEALHTNCFLEANVSFECIRTLPFLYNQFFYKLNTSHIERPAHVTREAWRVEKIEQERNTCIRVCQELKDKYSNIPKADQVLDLLRDNFLRTL